MFIDITNLTKYLGAVNIYLNLLFFVLDDPQMNFCGSKSMQTNTFNFSIYLHRLT